MIGRPPPPGAQLPQFPAQPQPPQLPAPQQAPPQTPPARPTTLSPFSDQSGSKAPSPRGSVDRAYSVSGGAPPAGLPPVKSSARPTAPPGLRTPSTSPIGGRRATIDSGTAPFSAGEDPAPNRPPPILPGPPPLVGGSPKRAPQLPPPLSTPIDPRQLSMVSEDGTHNEPEVEPEPVGVYSPDDDFVPPEFASLASHHTSLTGP